MLSAGLARLSYGYPQAIEAMQEVGEEENMRLEHRLSYLALIGTISPMFGLLGTVDGMVQAFDVIAQSTVSPKPSELAQGIATALVTTLVGLWLAIPAIAAFNILRNRVSRLVLEVGIVSEGLMSRFQNVGPKKGLKRASSACESPNHSIRTSVEMDMTPMIDVTFQLIAFFMFVLNFSEVDQDQRINLPSSELAKPPEAPYEQPLTIQLTADDTILFAGDELTPDELQSALMREAQIIKAYPNKKLSDVTVVIRADRVAKTGKVQEIIQMCQKAGFDTFALRGSRATRPTLIEP